MSNPFIDQSAEVLGDIALLGKYRFLRQEGNLRSSNLSLLLGLEVPSGSTRISSGGRRALPSVQPGTGALNPFVALSGTHGFIKTRIDATLLAKLNQEGSQGIQQGNAFAASLGIGHRFWMEKYPGATWAAGLGLQWRHQSRGDVSGQLLMNSGFNLRSAKTSSDPSPWTIDVVEPARPSTLSGMRSCSPFTRSRKPVSASCVRFFANSTPRRRVETSLPSRHRVTRSIGPARRRVASSNIMLGPKRSSSQICGLSSSSQSAWARSSQSEACCFWPRRSWITLARREIASRRRPA